MQIKYRNHIDSIENESRIILCAILIVDLERARIKFYAKFSKDIQGVYSLEKNK